MDAPILTHNAYGKSQVRLTRVARRADRHELTELCIAMQLEGDFSGAYLDGDNSQIVATDSMKNIVYVLAQRRAPSDLETFGQTLARHFLDHYAHVSSAKIDLVEQPWRRIPVGEQESPHAFIGGGSEQRTCQVTLTRQGLRVESGLAGLQLLKTADSAFAGFIRDAYTTLPETDDRILATELSAQWLYREVPADPDPCYEQLRRSLLETFAQHQSLSVQQTLYAMGAAALAARAEIEQICLTMPNQHRILVNLKPFGLENRNEVFVHVPEPYGLITGTLRRGDENR